MIKDKNLDKVAINIKSHKILQRILKENPKLKKILFEAEEETEVIMNIKEWVMKLAENRPHAYSFYKGEVKGREAFEKLSWNDYAIIRILDYIHNTGRTFSYPNLRRDTTTTNPFKILWLAAKYGTGGGKQAFFHDMLFLFRQLNGDLKYEKPKAEQVVEWMDRHPSGLDQRIIKIRKLNRDRIINVIIKKIDKEEVKDKIYYFEEEMSYEQKYMRVREWWKESKFHLRLAIRTPKLLNEMLGRSLSPKIMRTMYQAEEAGIPFFITPYYLSLLDASIHSFAPGADLAIRDYVVHSKELIEEFGNIKAWEKEDIIEPGKPNAAGWLLPSYNNVHRRYPEVAILIPDTMGRACAGLCVSCQRMYDFQSGNLNFNLDKLTPRETWPQKLIRLLEYFEEDSQLRDILITGGDALMSTDKSLKRILDEVYNMAVRKKENNERMPEGKKYAELLRVRLGTRIPVYLPQRITEGLVDVLKEFKVKASKIGVKQFVIQTHFESAMEITREAKEGIKSLNDAGWTVTNQQVFTAAASRRGHTAKLRQELCNIGIIPYYTFSVKGYMENWHNFATNERAMQEQMEEKILGTVPEKYNEKIKEFPFDAKNITDKMNQLKEEANLPFLATDRNVMNLPGVGKSLTYRVIGLTRYGRRILEFDHDETRTHSPIVEKMGKVIIIESKSIYDYLKQLDSMGEDRSEYETIYGYSIGETEPRTPIYEYPEYDYEVTDDITNYELEIVSDEN
jgi:lysine 2,3-aminomutase